MPTKALIPLPSNLEPTGSRCVQVMIPDDPEWFGMFWGALSQLTAWNSYKRSGDTSGSDVASIWKQVIADARVSNCEGVVLNWYLSLDVNYGFYDIDVWNHPIVYTGSGGVLKTEYTLICWGDEGGAPDFTISGRARDDDSYVGGTFDDWFITSDTDPAGKAFVLTTLDCLGNLVVNTEFTPKHFNGDLQGGQFVAGTATVYFLHMTILGDWLCAQA